MALSAVPRFTVLLIVGTVGVAGAAGVVADPAEVGAGEVLLPQAAKLNNMMNTKITLSTTEILLDTILHPFQTNVFFIISSSCVSAR